MGTTRRTGKTVVLAALAAVALVGGVATGGASPAQAVTAISLPGYSEYLQPGQFLLGGQAVASADRRYGLLMGKDGTLRFYGPGGRVLWDAGVTDVGNFAKMGGDGNLAVYHADSTPIWSGETWWPDGAFLKVQNDGKMVLYDVTWSVPLAQNCIDSRGIGRFCWL